MTTLMKRRTARPIPLRQVAILVSLMFLGALPTIARAQSIFNIGNGNWNTPELWSPTGVPSAGTAVRIGGLTARIATINTSDAVAGNTLIGYGGGETGTLLVTGTDSLLNTDGAFLIVGYSGSGSMTVQAGSSVSNGTGAIGFYFGSTGVVTVTGGDSLWANGGPLYLGDSGNGTLLIEAGGKVSNTEAYLAVSPGGMGKATVTGADSLWENSGILSVGNSENGTLNIEAGGKVTSATGSIASLANSMGTVAITGKNSLWENSGQLVVGSAGNGVLNVAAGARATSGELVVGNLGSGAMNIEGGAKVASTTGIIGHLTPSSEIRGVGIVTVTGEDSLWENSGFLRVGYSGEGTLNIAAGARVSNTVGLIGFETAGSGTVTATGSNTHWENSSVLYVGVGGNGILNIEAGARVSDAGGGYIGNSSATTGTVTVTGEGSFFQNSGYLFLGNSEAGAAGTLHINDRGTVGARGMAEGVGNGTVIFDGGILQAQRSSTAGASFISGFELGDLTLADGGGTIDSNGFNILAESGLSGVGGLTKTGAGTLTLSAASDYAGGTIMNGGTLSAGHDNALGTGEVTVNAGTFLVQTGVTVRNEVILSGGTLEKSLASGSNMTNSIKATSEFAGGHADTTANILAGTTSAATTLTASFAATSGGSNSGILSSDVLHLSGVLIVSGQITDLFVLELSMTNVGPDSYLGWLNGSNQWVNAIDGNAGNNATFAQQDYRGSFAAFQAVPGNGTDLTSYIGAWGSTDTSVWAVLNHNSDFGVVPEPSTAALLALGALTATLVSRRRW